MFEDRPLPAAKYNIVPAPHDDMDLMLMDFQRSLLELDAKVNGIAQQNHLIINYMKQMRQEIEQMKKKKKNEKPQDTT